MRTTHGSTCPGPKTNSAGSPGPQSKTEEYPARRYFRVVKQEVLPARRAVFLLWAMENIIQKFTPEKWKSLLSFSGGSLPGLRPFSSPGPVSRTAGRGSKESPEPAGSHARIPGVEAGVGASASRRGHSLLFPVATLHSPCSTHLHLIIHDPSGLKAARLAEPQHF